MKRLVIDEESRVFTRERLLTAVLALLTILALYACYRIAQPFIPPVAFALALAVATDTPFRWLRQRLGNDTAAAAVAVVLVALLIIGPLVSLTAHIVQLAVESIAELQGGGGFAGLQARVEQQPFIGPMVREFSERFRLEEQIGAIGRAVAERASGVLSGSVGVLTQLAFTLFILFFLYRDRWQALNSLRKLVPLSEREADRVFARIGSTIAATVNGSLTVALVQAVLAGIVYALLGVPGAVLWGAVTFITALIPVLGTFLVWAPIALYLALTGSVYKAIFLVIWGGVVVGSVDNVLYPYLVGDKLRMHTVPTLFAVLGGITLFGPAGLILGPMTVAITMALMDVWWLRTEHGQAAESEISKQPVDRSEPSEIVQERGA
jgi:predicted PurR-regulated permease PerM